MDYLKVGKISHYFDKIGVAVLDASENSVSVGDVIRVGEFGEGFEQKVDSMQVDHETVQEAKIGDQVGLKVAEAVKPGTMVYKVSN